MIELHGTIQHGELMLPAAQGALRRQWLSSSEGKEATEILKLTRKSKSYSQIKNHWGNAITRIIQEFDDNGWDASILYRMDKPTGVPVNKDMLQQFFYALFPTHDDSGRLITMSSPDFTTEHASRLFENVRNFAASQWSIYIPDPDIDWKQKARGNPPADF